MPATLTYSPLLPQKPADCLRKNTRRYAQYAETHPVQPLKGLRETRAAYVSYRAFVPAGHAGCGLALSYRALAPGGAGFCYRICTGTSESRLTAHYSLLTANSSYTFSAKEKDLETGLSYFGSRYYSSDLSVWLSVDPMSDKYPSLSPYVYCANNPVKLVDPNGEEIDNPPTEYNLTINGTTAILQTPDGSSKQYDLQNKKEYNNLLSNVNNALSAGSTVVGTVGVAGEKSKATFRMTNSKGQLDFRFYAKGWKGNQYVTPTMLSKAAKGLKIGGSILGGISAGISFLQAAQAKSTSERNWLIADGCAGLTALAGPIGMGASMYYFAVVKNADKIFNMLKQDALDRADMMSKEYPALRIGMR